jgi:hypothetical protein
VGDGRTAGNEQVGCFIGHLDSAGVHLPVNALCPYLIAFVFLAARHYNSSKSALFRVTVTGNRLTRNS